MLFPRPLYAVHQTSPPAATSRPTWAHFQGRTHSAAQLLLLLILTLDADMRLQQALKASDFHAGQASEQCQQARHVIHEVGCHDSAAEPLQGAGLG